MTTTGQEIEKEINDLIVGVDNKEDIIKILKGEIEKQKKSLKYRQGLDNLCCQIKIKELRLKIAGL